MKQVLGIALFSLLLSCSNTSSIKPVSTGQFGEIFVVVDEDLMNENLRSAVRESLAAPQLLYGGEEPYFNIAFLTPAGIRGSLVYEGTMLVVTRSGLKSGIAKLMPSPLDSFITSKKRTGVSNFVQKDIWSSPQRILFLLTDNGDSAATFIRQNQGLVRQKMLELELQEITGRVTHVPNELISKEIEEKHGISVKAPGSYHIASNSKINEKEGFVWLRSEGSETDLNIVIHYQPYTDTNQLELKNLIARRDSVVKSYITGEAAGSYMATDNQFSYYLETVDFNGHYARAYNGYWTLENDFMGGPYYSITVVDEEHERLITLEGFIYAPDKEKTRYLRELKGILFGVRF